MSVTIVVNFQAGEGNAEHLLALLQKGRDFCRKAEGCESLEVFSPQQEHLEVMDHMLKQMAAA